MPTILLVEDNGDNREIYRIILEHVGYSVLLAEDGEAGVRAARANRPDLVLMDISLPGMDGFEATRILKSDPATGAIPVVALTAHLGTWVGSRCAEVGCDGHLTKPIAPTELVREVGRVFESA